MGGIVGKIETQDNSDSGYACREYARSLEEFGAVRELPISGGRLLVSRIAGSELFDGMGCYPLFCCHDWSALRDDLDSLAASLVSARIVTDPFADVDISTLREAFPDTCYEYKQHFVTDLSQSLEQVVASHHLRNVRKALDRLEVRQSTGDADLLRKWQPLYDTLICRHGIDGIARFSPLAFERQAKVPGFISFSAIDDDDTCGMNWWYVRGDVAYYHLGAYSDRGYELGTSYALFWNALQYFGGIGLRWACLGAGAGVTSTESGLTRFKRGWATHTRPAYLCGRIFQPAVYAKLAAGAPAQSGFFPAYRAA